VILLSFGEILLLLVNVFMMARGKLSNGDTLHTQKLRSKD